MTDERLGDFMGPFVPIDYTDSFTAAEFARLQKGIPDFGSDTRWQIRVADLTCYLFRNWTDYGVYILSLTPREDRYVVVSAQVCMNNARYKTPGLDQEPELLRWIVRHVILEQDVPYPS